MADYVVDPLDGFTGPERDLHTQVSDTPPADLPELLDRLDDRSLNLVRRMLGQSRSRNWTLQREVTLAIQRRNAPPRRGR